jgi:sucrose-6-phosphate hydrolase SacC (GH32 family)
LTLTRELCLTDDGRLVAAPVPELSLLHGPARHVPLDARNPSRRLPDGPVDLDLTVSPGRDGRCSVSLCDVLTVELDVDAGTVRLDRHTHEESRRSWDTGGSLRPGPRAHVRIILDASVVEVFVAGGPAYTERCYLPDVVQLSLRGGEDARCDVEVRSL